jgi:uncharacterized membrane protein
MAATTEHDRSGDDQAERTGAGQGRARRGRLVVAMGLAATLVGSMAVVVVMPSGVAAADPLTVFTPYPAVSVAPGSKVSFTLTVKSNVRRQVALAVSGVPSGWSATLYGGGYVIDAVTADPSTTSPEVRLDVTVPAETTTKTARIAVTGSSGSLSDRLALTVGVNTEAGGSVDLKTDFPALQGPASGTFSFSLTLSNNTPQDLTFALSAQGPAGWTVTAHPSSQEQASSTTVNAGSTATVSVSANPPDAVTAGDYPITVTASSGPQTVDAKLGVTIVGDYKLTLTTPDGRLNANGTAGSQISRSLSIHNDGSAPLNGVKVSATPPNGWKVTFSPSDTIDQVAPGQDGQVTALITPSGDAVAGDYVVSFSASAASEGSSGNAATASQEIRVTVETSLVWGLVGLLLIAAVLAGLFWVFRTYGRR